MKFIYEGEYPAQGFIEQYGVRFEPGVPSEVSDEWAIRKLSAHPMFVDETLPEPSPEVEKQLSEVARDMVHPKRRGGRPPKVTNAPD